MRRLNLWTWETQLRLQAPYIPTQFCSAETESCAKNMSRMLDTLAEMLSSPHHSNMHHVLDKELRENRNNKWCNNGHKNTHRRLKISNSVIHREAEKKTAAAACSAVRCRVRVRIPRASKEYKQSKTKGWRKPWTETKAMLPVIGLKRPAQGTKGQSPSTQCSRAAEQRAKRPSNGGTRDTLQPAARRRRAPRIYQWALAPQLLLPQSTLPVPDYLPRGCGWKV